MNKIVINIVLTVTFSLFAFGWLLDHFADESVSQQSEKTNQLRIQLINGIISQLSTVPPDDLLQNIQALSKQFNLPFLLENVSDYSFDRSLKVKLVSPDGLMLASEEGPFLLKAITNHPDRILRLSLAPDAENNNFKDLALTLLLYLSLSLVLIIWALPLVRSLSNLTDAAAKFGKGDLAERVQLGQFSQLSQLEKSFNNMAEQIEQLVEENKLLANSLSHDLRTPLACFRFGLDASLHEQNLDKKNGYIRRMEADLERMELMLSAFLDYASMERNRLDMQFETVSMISFIRSIVSDMDTLAKKQNVELAFACDCDDTTIRVDKVWMYRALSNLMVNAIEYAQQKVNVVVDLKTNSDGEKIPICLIADDGQGIPITKRKEVFTPFVRLDSSRQRKSSNFGLGLAIVKRVLYWHQYSVTVTDFEGLNGSEQSLLLKKPNGAIFRLTLHPS
ncbi:MAG: ATP-binding protein [Pseudomonadota bacterium]